MDTFDDFFKRPLNPFFVNANALFPVDFFVPDLIGAVRVVVANRDSPETVCNLVAAKYTNSLYASVNAEIVLMGKLYSRKSSRAFIGDLFVLFGLIIATVATRESDVFALFHLFSTVVGNIEGTVYCIIEPDGSGRQAPVGGSIPPPTPGLGIEWIEPLVTKIGRFIPRSRRTELLVKLRVTVSRACRTVSLLAREVRTRSDMLMEKAQTPVSSPRKRPRSPA